MVDTAEAGEAGLPRYTQIWAFDRPGEKRAFEELIDFITERRTRHPGLHVCHCNHYEPTSAGHLTELHGTRQEAVGALTGRFAAREDEVDGLFRLGVFTDLYRVVRQGVRAGVESYSIKRLEPLCGYGRRVDLAEATASLIVLEAALEDGTAAGDGERRRVVAGYNEDDCRATLALRDWLEARRAELAERLGEELPRPVSVEKPGAAGAPGTARIRSALLAGVSAETSGAIAWGVSAETSEGRARALLADLLDWHRHEDKPAWWRYFYLCRLSSAELIGEPDALGGLTGGEIVDQVKKSVVRRFSFPPQEHKFSAGETAVDPVTERGWSVWAVDDAAGTIELKGWLGLRRTAARRPDRGVPDRDDATAGAARGRADPRARRAGAHRRHHRAVAYGHPPPDDAVCVHAGWSEFAFAYIAVELGKWVADTVFLAPLPARRRRCRRFLRGLTSE